MKAFQKTITSLSEFGSLSIEFTPDVILLFISPGFPNTQEFLIKLHEAYPNSTITGCSTSGEIHDTSVIDDSIVINALKFEKTKHKIASININDVNTSSDAGEMIAEKLLADDLKHVLIFSDGLKVNGAALVKGLTSLLDNSISITGGLAGDGTNFNSTFTVMNENIYDGEIIGLGLYGNDLKVGYSSKGGWDSFGLERAVTKSKDNVLYELDGLPALDLYKSYLGEKAADLPSSGLLFPLSLRENESQPVVRTILGIDEAENSLTFAGSIPEGSYVRLMKANVDRLINGAEDSAQRSQDSMPGDADFALLISCVGRRLVLKQIVEEEVEAVREVLGDKPIISGFYSYGELAPFGEFNPCRLHNQTMTITTFSE